MTDDLTAQRARELLVYDQLIGTFQWSHHHDNGRKAGRPVGTRAANWYIVIRMHGRVRRAHRLAWLIVYGAWPGHAIDHINGRRDDNRICNLRDVPPIANAANARRGERAPKLIGACPAPGGRWEAVYMEYGERISVGVFDTPDAANKAALEHQLSAFSMRGERPRVRMPVRKTANG